MLPLLFEPENSGYAEFEKEIEAYVKKQQAAKDSLMQLAASGPQQSKATDSLNIKPFRFNPNNLPRDTWKKLGLTDQQIDNIKNYEANGGKFNTKNDLAKMYSISAEEYKKLEPYIVIPGPYDIETAKPPLTPFPFDPNTVTYNELLAMGLSDQIANNIINYRSKGGRFENADDFGKLYTLSETDFQTLKPYINIELQILPFEKQPGETLAIIELNTADTLDLQQLTGIGPSFARRIIKYRDLLGGYHHKEQLLEVYGMDSVKFALIATHVSVNPVGIQKININSASVKELINHPYIEFYLAKSIITYRERIGSYKNIEELLNAKLIYQELYLKIAPYLTLNEPQI